MLKYFARLVTLLLVVLVLAGSTTAMAAATADGKWRFTDVDDSVDDSLRGNECTSVVAGRTCYHTYTAADQDSLALNVRAIATLCFNPDTGQAGAAGLGQIKVWYGTVKDPDPADPNDWMVLINGTALDGDGAASPQTACIYSIPTGTIFVESVVTPDTGEIALVTITGLAN